MSALLRKSLFPDSYSDDIDPNMFEDHVWEQVYTEMREQAVVGLPY